MQTQNRKLNFNQPMPIIEQQNQVIEVNKEDNNKISTMELLDMKIDLNINCDPDNSKGFYDYTNNFKLLLSTIKAEILERKKTFKLDVSEDSITKARESAAKFRKKAKEVKDEFKKSISFITDEVEILKGEVNEISSLLLDAADKIGSDIETALIETRNKISIFAENFLISEYKRLEILDDFKTINISNLKDDKGNINSKRDDITPSCKTKITQSVLQKQQTQSAVQIRLLKLENECLKAGILPLLKDDVSSFLMESDEVYNHKLQSLILKTKEREEKIKAQAIEREKSESEAKTNAEISRIKAESDANLEIQRAKMEADNQAKINAETIAKKQQEQVKTLEEVAKIEDKKQEIDNEFYNFSVKFKIEKARLDANGASFEEWTETLKIKLSECFKTFDGITCARNEPSLSLDVQDDLRFLAALREAGVNNWNDYDIACDIYNGRY